MSVISVVTNVGCLTLGLHGIVQQILDVWRSPQERDSSSLRPCWLGDIRRPDATPGQRMDTMEFFTSNSLRSPFESLVPSRRQGLGKDRVGSRYTATCKRDKVFLMDVPMLLLLRNQEWRRRAVPDVRIIMRNMGGSLCCIVD